MYPSKEARELAILLRISSELDIVGDVTATVESPSELLAWTLILHKHQVLAWRATDSGHRYIQVTAHRSKAPIRGDITAILHCERHPDFWHAAAVHAQYDRLLDEELSTSPPGGRLLPAPARGGRCRGRGAGNWTSSCYVIWRATKRAAAGTGGVVAETRGQPDDTLLH